MKKRERSDAKPAAVMTQKGRAKPRSRTLLTKVRPKRPPVARDAFRDVYAVVLAGGIGTRFWPLSTPARPKQFLTELADRSLYVQTVDRARLLVPPDRILIMTGAPFLGFIRQQTPEIPLENVIVEPLRRDTGPAIILAAFAVAARRPDGLMVAFPSDHFVGDNLEFRRTVAAAIAQARCGGLGTIGIPPTYPATVFGYLRLAGPAVPLVLQRVKQFVEKPDRAKAEQYAASGHYLWNSGMFIWRARTLLDAAKRHLPETYKELASAAAVLGEAAFPRRVLEVFQQINPVSIDYGIMEKADDVWCVPAAFAWNDIGGWLATGQFIAADDRGNHVRGDVFLDEVSGAIVIGAPGRPIVVAGLADCVVVQGDGGTLVCSKSALARLRQIVGRVLEPKKG